MSVDEPDLIFSEVSTLEVAHRRKEAPALVEFTANDTGGTEADPSIDDIGHTRARVNPRRRPRP